MSTVVDSLNEKMAGTRPAPSTANTSAPLTVLDVLMLLWTRRVLLGKAAAIGAAAGLALAFLLPVEYTAVTTILPPAPSSSLASAFAAQSGELGLLAGLASSSLGIRNPADLCVLMLRSRTVEDAVIERFGLMQEYRKKRMSDTRTALQRRTSVTLNLKSGLIAIAARDHDPGRAAELANGYVDEFRRFSASLAMTEAGQRRRFFEQQLLQARNDLTDAEEAFKNTQQSTGMLDPGAAAKASLESAVVLRAQIAAKEVELHTMSTYATAANPRLVQLKQGIAALEAQLAELGGSAPDDVADDMLIPKGKIPEAGAEYLRRLRDVKYQETLVAILARQYEIARLDEARQGAAIEVVDLAVTPDRRSSPKRLATLLGCIAFALLCAGFWVIHMRNSPQWDLRRPALNVFLAVVLLALAPQAFAQLGGTQATEPPAGSADCSDAAGYAQGVPCGAQEQNRLTGQSRMATSPDLTGTLIGPARGEQSGQSTSDGRLLEMLRDAERRERAAQPPGPRTEFEQMAADSAGRPLTIFGQSLFDNPPETFAPADGAQVPSDYVVGPGDQLRIRVWGQLNADLSIQVDRSGQVYIPQVGEVPVAGVRFSDLEGVLTRAVGQFFKSYNLAVSMGRLHQIQVFVVGQARAPGMYTVGSLSTLVNAVFASGGPLPQGSLRQIQLRRGAQIVQEFDLYDLLVNGDKSHDLPLQSGDVVLIPPVGPLVAIAGSVNAPAIYELRERATLGSLIQMAGGLSSVADGSNATVERISKDRVRTIHEFTLDANGLAFPLQGGDIVHISSIVPRFDDTVTLRGYVADPGRYPYTPGMRVRDLLPNAQALLSREYWLERAGTTNGREREYPVRKILPPVPQVSPNPAPLAPASEAQVQPQSAPVAEPVAIQEVRQETLPQYYERLADSETLSDPGINETNANASPNNGSENQSDALTRDLRQLVPSVNWRYALIQRVDPVTLKTELISFDLGKAVVDGDAASNLALAPGDIVTVFSQQDITVPQLAQTRYVKVEGEVEHPGVYEIAQGQTLRDALEAAGGLTAKAYPYGARFTRESARIEQQKGLDEMVRTAEAEVRASMVHAVAAGAQDASKESAQQSLLASLRSIQASGRIVLAMRPDAASLADFPPIALEDGDRIVIPARTDTVTVSGAVYNPASFVYDPHRKVGNYLEMAGKGALNANPHRAFVLRADGSVISRQEAGGFFHSGFDQLPMHPGDQIVVPERVNNGVVQALHDWPQILTPLALTSLAIAAVAP